MNITKIRSLRADEIEVRVAQVTEKGAQLLLYKDSRCDKRILDETFGIYGWKNDFKEILGNLFCTVSVYDAEKNVWIDKTDCGVESFSEKEKGQASDAFKRACFNLGIGRELYTKIFYFVKVPKKNTKGKYELVNKNEKFNVSEITINEKTEKIEKIKIANEKGEIVFSYGYGSKTPKKETSKNTTDEKITDEQIKLIHTLFTKIDVDGFKEKTYKKLKIESSKELSKKGAKELIDFLQKALAKKESKSEEKEKEVKDETNK